MSAHHTGYGVYFTLLGSAHTHAYYLQPRRSARKVGVLWSRLALSPSSELRYRTHEIDMASEAILQTDQPQGHSIDNLPCMVAKVWYHDLEGCPLFHDSTTLAVTPQCRRPKPLATTCKYTDYYTP